MDAKVIAIYVAPERRKPMEARDSVRAVPNVGIEGDHRWDPTGELAKKKGPGREITLIEVEAIEAVFRDYEIQLGADQTRRNVLTRGVALNHLIGKEFRIGTIRLVGVELCEPCSSLESMTQKGVKAALVHRGGIRCRILDEGTLRVGDAITTP